MVTIYASLLEADKHFPLLEQEAGRKVYGQRFERCKKKQHPPGGIMLKYNELVRQLIPELNFKKWRNSRRNNENSNELMQRGEA